jgi:hypothetical protein
MGHMKDTHTRMHTRGEGLRPGFRRCTEHVHISSRRALLLQAYGAAGPQHTVRLLEKALGYAGCALGCVMRADAVCHTYMLHTKGCKR